MIQSLFLTPPGQQSICRQRLAQSAAPAGWWCFRRSFLLFWFVELAGKPTPSAVAGCLFFALALTPMWPPQADFLKISGCRVFRSSFSGVHYHFWTRTYVMPWRHCNYDALAMHLPPPNRDRRASGISPPQRMRSYHVKVQSLKEFDSRRWVSSGDPPLGGCFFLKWRITSNDNRRGRHTFSSFARPRQLTSQFFCGMTINLCDHCRLHLRWVASGWVVRQHGGSVCGRHVRR